MATRTAFRLLDPPRGTNPRSGSAALAATSSAPAVKAFCTVSPIARAPVGLYYRGVQTDPADAERDRVSGDHGDRVYFLVRWIGAGRRECYRISFWSPMTELSVSLRHANSVILSQWSFR
jgi:hypothetical protein